MGKGAERNGESARRRDGELIDAAGRKWTFRSPIQPAYRLRSPSRRFADSPFRVFLRLNRPHFDYPVFLPVSFVEEILSTHTH